MSGNDKNIDPDFAKFAAAGEVEVGSKPADTETPAAKPAARRAPPKPAAERPAQEVLPPDDGDDLGDQGGEGGENQDPTDFEDDLGDDDDLGNDEGDENGERRETAESRVKRIKRERAEAKRERDDARAETERLRQEIASLKNGGLSPANITDTAVAKLGPAPDPSDMAKYPLGHLDAQYIEDRTDWAADKKLAERSDADLQRQQENQRNQATQAEQQQLATAFKNVMDKGTAIYDDFEEVTMKTKWSLDKPTFDAAAEVPNGARILYNLAKNSAEADRVAKLSPYQQALYVNNRNDEIAEKLKVRKKPGAGAPPTQNARGGNSRVNINPGTDSLDEFEKLWNKK